MSAAVSGIVLAGGAGLRMGANKAALRLGGRTLLQIAVDTLSQITDDVVVAGGPKRGEGPGLPARFVADRVVRRGPIAGLDAGLRAIANDAALVVACDMPFLNAELLEYMSESLGRYDAVVPVIGGRQHPLHGVYSRSCLPLIEKLLPGGGSMRDLLASVRTKALPEHELRDIDADGLSCLNVNYPEEMERARELWERRRSEVAAS